MSQVPADQPKRALSPESTSRRISRIVEKPDDFEAHERYHADWRGHSFPKSRGMVIASSRISARYTTNPTHISGLDIMEPRPLSFQVSVSEETLLNLFRAGLVGASLRWVLPSVQIEAWGFAKHFVNGKTASVYEMAQANIVGGEWPSAAMMLVLFGWSLLFLALSFTHPRRSVFVLAACAQVVFFFLDPFAMGKNLEYLPHMQIIRFLSAPLVLLGFIIRPANGPQEAIPAAVSQEEITWRETKRPTITEAAALPRTDEPIIASLGRSRLKEALRGRVNTPVLLLTNERLYLVGRVYVAGFMNPFREVERKHPIPIYKLTGIRNGKYRRRFSLLINSLIIVGCASSLLMVATLISGQGNAETLSAGGIFAAITIALYLIRRRSFVPITLLVVECQDEAVGIPIASFEESELRAFKERVELVRRGQPA